MEAGTDIANLRKDLGYSSEVNSCDSVPETTVLHDDLKTTNENNLESNKMLLLELEKTKLALQEKIVECEKLKLNINKVEAEIEDLTTSLFEEANKMVYEANLKHNKAEKKLAVAEGKIEALEIEIGALKSIVITSTPSNPNPMSHPQLIKKSEGSPMKTKPSKNFILNNRKTEKKKIDEYKIEKVKDSPYTHLKLHKEMDELVFSQLKQWHKEITEQSTSINGTSTSFCCCQLSPTNVAPLDQCEMITRTAFLNKIFTEEVSPCLAFPNEELAVSVSSCIHKNLLSVELASNRLLEPAQVCSLSKTRSPCKHRIRFSDSDTWYDISQASRNKITSVCNFFTYLRYIRQGIVKQSVEQIYWEITNLRLEIALATLGYYKDN